MTLSFKNPLLAGLLVLALVIGSYFTWKYLDIKNQELQIKLNQEKSDSEKLKLTQELADVRIFTGSIVRFNDTILEISTKWRDWKMDYKVSLPISEKFYTAINKPNNFNASLEIELTDKDWFKIESVKMSIFTATSLVDKNDKLKEKAISWSMKISKESYMMINSISILSTID